MSLCSAGIHCQENSAGWCPRCDIAVAGLPEPLQGAPWHPPEALRPDETKGVGVAPPQATEPSEFQAQLDELVKHFCSATDNLGDMPISDAWADKWATKAHEMLDRHNFYRAHIAALSPQAAAEATPAAPKGQP